MPELQRLECEGCGAGLEFEPGQRIITCENCGSKFLLDNRGQVESRTIIQGPGSVYIKGPVNLDGGDLVMRNIIQQVHNPTGSVTQIIGISHGSNISQSVTADGFPDPIDLNITEIDDRIIIAWSGHKLFRLKDGTVRFLNQKHEIPYGDKVPGIVMNEVDEESGIRLILFTDGLLLKLGPESQMTLKYRGDTLITWSPEEV